MATNVPGIVWTPQGPQVPTEQAIVVGLQADYVQAFGADLNPALETPQGQLISSSAAIIGDKNDNILTLVDQFDPNVAAGRAQDALARIYFLERKPAVPTQVDAVCTGAVGTTIPPGAAATDPAGNRYITLGGGVIGGAGTVTLTFTCTVTGPIICAAGALATIYQAVPGWDSITNPDAGVTGVDVESRADFEQRRRDSVALNAKNSIISIRGAVLNVPDVVDAYVIANATASPVTITGVTIAAYALYAAVAGGDSQAVAEAIWSKKPPGQPMYAGNTSETVVDDSDGYSPPYPSYTIVYQDPAALPCIVAVRMTNSSAVPSNALALVQQAVFNAFTGADGGLKARIGQIVYATRFIPAIAKLGAWASEIVSIKLGSGLAPGAGFTGAIAASVLTVAASPAPTGALAVGQIVQGAGVAPGTVITSLGSGTGGAGTYNLSQPQTVASSVMSTLSATLDTVAVPINRRPTLDPLNVTLTLV